MSTIDGTLRPARSTSGFGWFRDATRRRLDRLKTGQVVLRDGESVHVLGQRELGAEGSLYCELDVHDARFYRDIATRGSIGAAEAFAEGYWTTSDLTTLMRILARDDELNRNFDRGAARWKLLTDRLRHRIGRRNTIRGSRRNIVSHYDLGNEFFATFLDPTMTYSCGIFSDPSATMEEASRLKYDLICRKLGLGPDDEVLEIGCGWGGFAQHAVEHYGCRVVGVTVSPNQFEYAQARMRAAGIDDRVTLLLEDYRHLPRVLGRRFDKLVSIEMIEAVGHKFLPGYFRVCSEMMKPDGLMLLQAITIADERYDEYRRSVDFIQRYIFPGGCLPSVTRMSEAMTQESSLRISHLQDITSHYVTTLRRWREQFRARTPEIAELGLSANFRRLWEFYFSYCECGFLERAIGDVQLMLSGPLTPMARTVPQE